MDPVIVVGPPRSGTSVIARLLQEKLDVMMDEGLIRKDSLNRNGYYEDHRLVKLNLDLFNRWDMGTVAKNDTDSKWMKAFSDWTSERSHEYERWGFKDPRMIGILNWVCNSFENPIFIWPVRQTDQIIQSQVTKLKYPVDIAREYTVFCEKYIARQLKDKALYKINLSRKRSEKKLVKQLRTILKNL